MKVLRLLNQAVYSRASQYVARTTLVDGALVGSNEPFRCLFVDNSGLKEYLIPKIYVSQPRIVQEKRVWLPRLRRVLQRASSSLDMCIAVLPLRYEPEVQGFYDFRSQGVVRLMINITGHENEDKIGTPSRKKLKETERRIKKFGFTYRVSHEPRDLIHFYHHMHVPLIKKQHGDLAYCDSLEGMEEYFKKGFLLLVVQDGHDVAGGLCWESHGTLIYRRAGVLNGDEAYIQQGGQSAIRFFIIQEARRNKLAKVDFMISRAFMTDGIYRHKREWGATVYQDDEQEFWTYFFNMGSSEKVAQFFKRSPVIVQTKTGLSGVVGVDNGATLALEVQRALTDQFYAPGLEGLIVMMPHSKEPIAIRFDTKDCNETVS